MEIFTNLKNINIATLIVSICAILTLIVVKEYFDPFYKKQMKKIKLFKTVQIPIPTELIVVCKVEIEKNHSISSIDYYWYIGFVFYEFKWSL